MNRKYIVPATSSNNRYNLSVSHKIPCQVLKKSHESHYHCFKELIRKLTQVSKTRTCVGTCRGCPNGWASEPVNSHKLQIVVNFTHIICMTCVGWPNGEKLTSTCVQIWAQSKSMQAIKSQRKWTQVGGQTKRKLETCMNLRVYLARANNKKKCVMFGCGDSSWTEDINVLPTEIKEQVKYIEKSVSAKEPRFLSRVLRSIPATRKKLTHPILRRLICGYFPGGMCIISG